VIPKVLIPGQNILREKNQADVVTISQAYVFYHIPTNSILGVATSEGTATVSYFSVTDVSLKTNLSAITEGQYVNLTGTVAVVTGGAQARSKHLSFSNTSAAPVIVTTPSWSFDGFASAATIDMDTGFKAFGNSLQTNNLGVMYTFNNVRFDTVNNASSSSTFNYDYLNYTSLEVGKNELVENSLDTSNYFKIGLYAFSYGSNLLSTSVKYSIRAFVIGTNKDLPYVSGDNPIIRVSGYLSIINTENILPTAITITSQGSATSLVESKTLKLNYSVTPSFAKNDVTWSSSDTSIATVDQTGLVTGLAPGNVAIKATSQAASTVEKSFNLTVTAKIPVTSITISSLENATSLASNGQLQLTATVLPADAFDKTVTWSSNDITVATVTPTGLVSGLTAGSVRITAAANETGSAVIGTFDLTLIEPIVLLSLTLSANPSSIAIGGTTQVVVTPTPSAWVGTYTFSSDSANATVSSEGLVTGVIAGTAIITATSFENNTINGTITITVLAPVFAPDLFISEYIEGASNNKAFEIANFTGADIDLSQYSIALYSNGSSEISKTQPNFIGILKHGEVFVIAGTLTVDQGMVAALAAIPAERKIVSTFEQGSIAAAYNGDDAIAILKGDTIIDVFGTIGFDPGTGWDKATYGVLATGVTAQTADRTLTRLPGFGPFVGALQYNAVTYNTAFNPIEWRVDAIHTQTLGTHTY
jgi:uncharacterized protein YjdB